jgi:hypothetical protein
MSADYVLQLRAHCKPGQPAHGDEDIGHYLDLVGYWREQCQKVQEENDRLRSINIRLERSNHLLSQHTNTTPDERPGTAPGIAKRKSAASPTRSPKRPKPPLLKSAEQTVAQTQEGIESDYNFLEGLGDGESPCWLPYCGMRESGVSNVSPDGRALIEALYTTHQLCRATAPDAETLCHHLVRTAASLGKVIRLVAHNHEHLSRQGQRTTGASSLAEDRSEFSHALTVSARAFMSVLVGITTMMSTSHDDRLPGLIICELAESFKSTLLAIESSARQTASSILSTSTPHQPKSGKGKSNVSVTKESVPARSLAHFLISLMGLLDKTNPIHQRIFDGFAFLLIERVGKRLYYCTFGRHRSADIESGLAPLPEPIYPTDKARQETEAFGIRLELKALVLILERAMGLAPHHMNPPTSRATKARSSNKPGRTLSMKTLSAAPKGRLSSLAKDRLQRTLVTCMYGHDQSDEFLDVLTKPIPSMRVGALQNVAKIEDKDVEQWYKEEVWRLLGWDIMARETGW